MGQGISHTVYMANACGQDIYVMASLSTEWAIIDAIADGALLLAAVADIAAVVTTAEALPEVINTLSDLYGYLKVAAQLLRDTGSISSRTTDAAQTLVNAFANTSIPIAFDDYKNVEEEGVLSIYLSPDGIASLLGASTVSVMVMSGDGKQVAMWDTGADDSWIATNQQTIVRSAYGSIWQQDPGAGTQNWSVLLSA